MKCKLKERQDSKFNEDHIAIIDIDHIRLEGDGQI